MMKLFLLVFALLFQYWDDSDAVKAMKAHVAEITLSQNEGRAPGSEGEKAVASYVSSVFVDKGLDLLSGSEGDVFGIDSGQGDTLVSRNVIAYLPGYDAVLRKHYIVVGARMDNLGTNELSVDGVKTTQIFPGANGNASGLAVLMELAGQAARNSMMFKRSIVFVAFGSSTKSFAGAWHFLHQTFGKDMKNIDAMVNLDMLGCCKDDVMAFTAGNEDLNHILANLSSSLQPVKPVIIPTEPYPSDHQVFYAAEIPSVMFTTGRYPEHNTLRDAPSILDFDLMEKETEYLYNFIYALSDCPEGTPSFYNIADTPEKGNDTMLSWAECDIPPAFLGNVNPAFFLEKWVYQYLKYPEACIRDGVQGRVMVDFVIGKDGSVSNVSISRSVDPELDAAALKVVEASPKWKPARMKGQKVACRMTIPVEFRLKKRK